LVSGQVTIRFAVHSAIRFSLSFAKLIMNMFCYAAQDHSRSASLVILLDYKLDLKCLDPMTETFVIMNKLISIAKVEAEIISYTINVT
jgi:hypothetical protein